LAPAPAAALVTVPATPLGYNLPEFVFEPPDGGRRLPGPLLPVPELDLTRFSPADATKITRLLIIITPRVYGTAGCD
jgi:hypothetical protein